MGVSSSAGLGAGAALGPGAGAAAGVSEMVPSAFIAVGRSSTSLQGMAAGKASQELQLSSHGARDNHGLVDCRHQQCPSQTCCQGAVLVAAVACSLGTDGSHGRQRHRPGEASIDDLDKDAEIVWLLVPGHLQAAAVCTSICWC